MDVSNLFEHFLFSPSSTCARPNLQLSQVYLPSFVSLSNDNGSNVTLILPTQQQDDEARSDAGNNSDDCDDDDEESEDSCTEDDTTEGKSGAGLGKRGKERPKCIHRTRYSREEYRCESCPYTCTTEKAFLKHVRRCVRKESDAQDSQLSPLSCPVCGKDRRNESSLSTHMVKHKSGKYFCCDLCKFKSVQLKKIIQHRRMHTGEKPHLCPHCSYRSSRRDNLRSHVRRMHNENDLHCDTFTPRKILLVPNKSS